MASSAHRRFKHEANCRPANPLQSAEVGSFALRPPALAGGDEVRAQVDPQRAYEHELRENVTQGVKYY